jgi:hypothetical protein
MKTSLERYLRQRGGVSSAGYAVEQGFRFNNPKMTDAERFSLAVSGIVDKRITLDE